MQTIRLFVGNSSTGKPVHEEVVVDPVGDRFRLVKSPGLVLGTAAGDLLAIEADGRFEIIERGRNVCIQIFVTQNIERVEAMATSEIEQLGGYLDGRAAKELVYTVSIDRGFPAIESRLNRIKSSFPEAEWYYGNVYDPRDGVTPLDWWK